MRCLVCGKPYFAKRTLKTLFKEETYYRCSHCLKKYRLNISYQVIPKEGGHFHIIGLFDVIPCLDLTAFNDEIAYVILKIKKQMHVRDTLLWVDTLEEKILHVLDFIDYDIYIITNQIYL